MFSNIIGHWCCWKLCWLDLYILLYSWLQHVHPCGSSRTLPLLIKWLKGFWILWNIIDLPRYSLGEKYLPNVGVLWSFIFYCWWICWLIYFWFLSFLLFMLALFSTSSFGSTLVFFPACKLDSPFQNLRPYLSNGDIWISRKLSKTTMIFSIFSFFQGKF